MIRDMAFVAYSVRDAATFEVDDVVRERERSIALGVPVTDLYDGAACTSAFVTDPEGNRF